jgi:hypothetical protein
MLWLSRLVYRQHCALVLGTRTFSILRPTNKVRTWSEINCDDLFWSGKSRWCAYWINCLFQRQLSVDCPRRDDCVCPPWGPQIVMILATVTELLYIEFRWLIFCSSVDQLSWLGYSSVTCASDNQLIAALNSDHWTMSKALKLTGLLPSGCRNFLCLCVTFPNTRTEARRGMSNVRSHTDGEVR